MFNWFMGPIKPFGGSNFMLTPPNMIESKLKNHQKPGGRPKK